LHRSRNRYFRRYHSARLVDAIGAMMRLAAAGQSMHARLRGNDPATAERAAVLATAARLYREAGHEDA
jgi:hypothetical protein